ncbi:MAG: chloramphenicol acetyltransferase [Bacteroidaceae bacterium]|nr:chloramphenicol acetyltransferase [Bacteroidaceae bacterium]MBQ7462311.1 chloramphenicol acetyltransferase [Bacteroidaceae bacterium]MBR0244595.1 chloramphenicol acetyltransferase [Bacteroidaceae bacterium]
MKQEIDPKDTNRAMAFELWMKSPMPMVTLTKTFDVTRLYKESKRRGLKFNMLLCWCIGKVASRMEEFYLLPEQGNLYKCDRLAINVIVNNKEGGINSCDIPYTDDLKRFGEDYMTLTLAAGMSCQSSFVDDAMVIGTSAVTGTELDSIVNQYCGQFNNPMVMWGRYRKHWFKVTLPISFQFHHVQMDGSHAAYFLEELQKTIKAVKVCSIN